MRRRARSLAVGLALTVAPALSAWAVQRCDVDGQSVNPNNGSTTEGKTGLMRCRDADSNVLVREQELQNGRFMGLVRFYRNGELEREHRVNERGNRDGTAREWNVGEGGGKRVLVREETLRDGRTIGVSRSWLPTGERKRLAFHGDDEREQASVEFQRDGKLAELRCAGRPVFGADFDDKAACGFAGAQTVVLYNARGLTSERVVFERGERRKSELLWESGAVRELREASESGGLERSFAADGTLRRERQWVYLASDKAPAAGERRPRVQTLEREYHESGKLVRERRWQPGERGGELVADATWYLNGQPKSRTEYAAGGDGKTVRREAAFHDNGQPASFGTWTLAARAGRNEYGGVATGVHKGFDEQGRLRSERSYDERGRIVRERDLDERGAVVRDDEVFEDGSRKAFGR